LFVLFFVNSLVFILVLYEAGFVMVTFYASYMQITVDYNALLNYFISLLRNQDVAQNQTENWCKSRSKGEKKTWQISCKFWRQFE